MHLSFRLLPAISFEEFDLRFHALDKNRDSKIDPAEFNDLLNIIAREYEKEESEPWLSRFPFYNSPSSNKLKGFVKSQKFEYVVIFVLLLNLAVMIAETTVDIQNKSGHKSWQKVEFVFAWIFLFEVAFRVYTYGFENYWNNSDNRLNFILTWVIVIGEILTLVSPKKLKIFSNEEWIRYLLVARMLRYIRLLMHVPSYQSFVDTFLYLMPSLMPYLGTIFCVMCIYCTLGIQIFGGLVNAGNSQLPSTDLADSNYLSFNFNDYPNGMVTLFNLIVMGSWQVWMKMNLFNGYGLSTKVFSQLFQDYVTLTGTSWTYTYFVSFYVITVLLLLNLIVAFVLQAFFAEMDLKLSLKNEHVEASIHVYLYSWGELMSTLCKEIQDTGTSGQRRQHEKSSESQYASSPHAEQKAEASPTCLFRASPSYGRLKKES
ncbi:ion transport domain-containing protein [Artemisia annua]|uniref:Ion transport domain-containing protein n=1 Tax=Artemisia annua TaxID=35608 RepID=A0A2U1L209_ARTAN|nr:ion transport domain-containing protein [Artemisia annua]